MLVRMYLDDRDWVRAEELLRRAYQQEEGAARRAERDVPPPDRHVLSLADAGVEARIPEPIDRAERWANAIGRRELFFAAAHRRGSLAEESGDTAAAVAEYDRLVAAGSAFEPTFTRLMILLEKRRTYAEALAIARRALTVRGSATFEQRVRQRIQRLEARLAPRGRKPIRTAVAPFLLRGGDDLAEWFAQLEVKGGAKQLGLTNDGRVTALGAGKAGALWLASPDLQTIEKVRDIPPRTEMCSGLRTVLISTEGTVAEGAALLQFLGDDWRTAASSRLPAVTSEVAACPWGLAAGCRDGALYAFDWHGQSLWEHRLDRRDGDDTNSRPAPYFVRSRPQSQRVVLSSWSDVLCLNADGRVAWRWRVPERRDEWKSEPDKRFGISVAMSFAQSGLVQALAATRDGGAYVLGSGELFRLDQDGHVRQRLPGVDQYARLVLGEEDAILALSSFGGLRFHDRSGRVIVTHPSKELLDLRWSVQLGLVAAYAGPHLQLFERTGRLVCAYEFTRRIGDVLWVGSDLVAAASMPIVLRVRTNLPG